MTASPTSAGTRSVAVEAPDSTVVGTALWLTTTATLALIAYYFLGYDQGAVSVFGADTHVHELFHDARHMLGFPCH
ncbi:CbtB-domain containing protein [Mycolicibacterium sp. 120266]|jgi:hypothetical protein|uniref:CbtB domain-containing protein n=1 Tax=Mycolicibacterium sp. 120266 TaxID=3090601 RepID=UPI00299D8823|nr:CbtB-domain containing protein [Mycolicibacterium sp. 120266]MDX1873815.1 CbtB-domain containing protein [Mycolicibacterium sp. 120266]